MRLFFLVAASTLLILLVLIPRINKPSLEEENYLNLDKKCRKDCKEMNLTLYHSGYGFGEKSGSEPIKDPADPDAFTCWCSQQGKNPVRLW